MTNDKFKVAIGKRVAELRKAKDWTLDELAKRSALKRSAISNYEQGARLPGPEEITLLAKAFDVSRAYLFCFDDNPSEVALPQIALADDSKNQNQPEQSKVAEQAIADGLKMTMGELIRLIASYSQLDGESRELALSFLDGLAPIDVSERPRAASQ